MPQGLGYTKNNPAETSQRDEGMTSFSSESEETPEPTHRGQGPADPAGLWARGSNTLETVHGSVAGLAQASQHMDQRLGALEAQAQVPWEVAQATAQLGQRLGALEAQAQVPL